MKIRREKIEELLGVALPENITEIINNLGFFGFEENDFINFEPASNRSDCNSIIGICCELSSYISSKFSLSFQNNARVTVHEEEPSDSPLKGWCVIKTNKTCADEQIRESVKANGLKSDTDIEIISGWLTLMTGCPFIWIEDCLIDQLKVQYDKEENCAVVSTGSHVFKWGEKIVNSIVNPNLSNGVFISVNIDAAVQKKYLEKSKMNVDMKNFYIRNGVSDFYIYASHLLSHYIDFSYICKKADKIKQFRVESSTISDLLGENISDYQINISLTHLGYSKINNTWLVPSFRNDILSIRDIVADIFRISRLFKKEIFDEEETDVLSDTRLFMGAMRNRHLLLSYGFDEICSFPFVYKTAKENESAVFVLNPPHINRNALPEFAIDGMHNLLKGMKINARYFEIKKYFRKEWSDGQIQFKEIWALSFGAKDTKDFTEYMAVLLELIPPHTSVKHLNDANEWIIHLREHDAIIKLREYPNYILLEGDIPLIAILNDMNRTDHTRKKHVKYGSIDLPITCLSTNFRDLVFSAAQESDLQCELIIKSWTYITINGQKRWNCKYQILFNEIMKKQYHRFNTALYGNAKHFFPQTS